MSKQVPKYVIEGDRVIFEDGIQYTMKPLPPGSTRASPKEMWALLSGTGPSASAAEIHEDRIRRQIKVQLGTGYVSDLKSELTENRADDLT